MSDRLLPLFFRAYKRAVSPFLHAAGIVPGGCRFQPSCSEYAVIALHHHGWLRGGWLSLRRLSRCRPGGGKGFDPVPGTWSPSSPQNPPAARTQAEFRADIYHGYSGSSLIAPMDRRT